MGEILKVSRKTTLFSGHRLSRGTVFFWEESGPRGEVSKDSHRSKEEVVCQEGGIYKVGKVCFTFMGSPG